MLMGAAKNGPAIAISLGLLFACAATRGEPSRTERGRYLLYAGGCISCHTDVATLKAKGPILGGGRAIKTPFGVFYGPNISPHQVHGIGRWREADFIRALREGRSPKGRHYFPSFPYTSFTRISTRDLKALFAYIMTLEPVARPSRPHAVAFPFNLRMLAGFWKWLYFRPTRYRPDPARTKRWNRGAYLVRALVHCSECHTPRGPLGGVRRGAYLSGVGKGGPIGSVPNITSDPKAGIGKWSLADIFDVLKLGLLPDGDFIGAEMADVVEHGTSHLTDADLNAIAIYLKSVPPIGLRGGLRK